MPLITLYHSQSRFRTLLLALLLAAFLAFILAGCFATMQLSKNTPPSYPLLTQQKAKAANLQHTEPNIEALFTDCTIKGDALSAFLVPETPNLWHRLQKGFGWPDMAHPSVIDQLNWLADRPQHTEIITTRSLNYLRYILDELDKRELPYELALIPMVESGYDPFAYSHAQASGLWQIMPKTAKYLGLRRDWWYDGRRDVVASTGAALDYLENLHKAFGDDWSLTLAAYNSGRGTLSKALKRNRKQNKPTDFWSLSLPKETKLYLPKILAMKQFLLHPELYGAELPPAANAPKLAVAEIDSQIDLAQAARLAGVQAQQIYELNPGFKRWATPPQGPHHIAVPAEKLDRFLHELKALPKEQRVTWHRHTIKNGDTLGEIAERYSIDTRTLRRINKLQGNNIRIGRTLLVPKAGAGANLNDISLAAIQQSSQVGASKSLRYTVKPGDSLSEIAQRFGTTSRAIARRNHLSARDVLRVGQRLSITSKKENDQRIKYRVKPGDALSAIASKFDVSVSDIERWNNIKKSSLLKPGQRLTIYVSPNS